MVQATARTLTFASGDLSLEGALHLPDDEAPSPGLPVGLQLVGRRFDEATVLRAAHAFETESGVPRPRPPVD